MALRQPNWDKYEAALLIEAYWRIKADRSTKGAIVAKLSSSLRKRASFEIDDTFRNENGINMRLGELDYLFSSGSAGLKNTSDLFRDFQIYIYRLDSHRFNSQMLQTKQITEVTTHRNICKENLHCRLCKGFSYLFLFPNVRLFILI